MLEATAGPRWLSPFVLAEVDHIVTTHVGPRAALDFLDDVASGGFRLEPFDGADVARTHEVMRRHLDLDVGWPTRRSSSSRSATASTMY